MLDKFKEKLSDMNLAIREAIKSADFEKAQALDNERQYFIITAMKDETFSPDDEFVEFLENCAKENAELVSELEARIIKLSSATHKTSQMMKGYNI